MPPPSDEGIVPSLEWWDEAFLPKNVREERKRSRAALEREDFALRAIQHCKTYKYVCNLPSLRLANSFFVDSSLRSLIVTLSLYIYLISYLRCIDRYIQHPTPVKPLSGDKPDEPMPVFLTKKERKRLRRTAREAREREKRDKMMMGLIPPPEPKFKLSNFMKVRH